MLHGAVYFFQDLMFSLLTRKGAFGNKLVWLHFGQMNYTCRSSVFIECVMSTWACLLHSGFHKDYIDIYKWHVKYSEQQQKQLRKF